MVFINSKFSHVGEFTVHIHVTYQHYNTQVTTNVLQNQKISKITQ